MKKNIKFTKNEEEIILVNYAAQGPQYIGKLLGRSNCNDKEVSYFIRSNCNDNFRTIFIRSSN